MLELFFLLVVILVPVVATLIIIDGTKKVPLALVILIIGIALAALLWWIGSNWAFTGGGDDEDYYNSSLYRFDSLSDWFDFRRIFKDAEQGGYNMLLTWIHQIVDDSLYLRKAVNLMLFLLLAPLWYSIGKVIGGVRLARGLFFAMLFISPLWFYWMFLLKDMCIVFLQSMFLWSAVKLFCDRPSSLVIVVLAFSTFLLLPFRVFLVIINISVLAIGVLLGMVDKGRMGSNLLKFGLVAVFILGFLVLASNPALLQKVGVKGEARTIDASGLEKSAEFYDKRRQYAKRGGGLSIVKYPILFVIGETAGLNPAAWSNFQPMSLRGLLAVPWILLAPPFFMLSAIMVLKKNRRYFPARPVPMLRMRRHSNPEDTIVVSGYNRKGLLLLFAFIAAYAIVAWVSADTTRWKMPAFPPMIAVAYWAAMAMPRKRRNLILQLWLAGASLFIVIYYALQ